MAGLPSSPTFTAALETLRGAERRTLKVIFRGLHPPQISELHGEFAAELLDQGGPVGQQLTGWLFRAYGPWVGKAFCPSQDGLGVGYNCFARSEGIQPRLPMDTSIEPSAMEKWDYMVIDYRRRNRGPIRWLRGELREFSPGVLLGIGS